MSDNRPTFSLEEALASRDFSRVREQFSGRLPVEVADLIEELDEDQRAIVFRLLPREQAAETFEYLGADVQAGLIKALAREQVASILNDMSPDDRTALLEELPAAVTRQALSLLSPDERQIARELLGYPEQSIGRLMTPDFVALRPAWTVDQALRHIRENGQDSETLNVLYVVDDRGKLVDDLRMRQLILADPAHRIADLIDGQFVALKATDDQETAVRVFAEYDRVAFPVTDSRGLLLGIVTVDDVLDVAEEEATEDIQKIAGMEALEEPYIEIGFGEMLGKRARWLVLLFFGQLLTINAIQMFAGQLDRVRVLAWFVPLIISSGGNSGAQAATLVVRSMALDEVQLRDWWRVLRREVAFGAIVGLVLAAVGFARIAIGRGLGEDLGAAWAQLAVVIGLSLVGVVIWGVAIGAMLPFVMRRLGADPAASSTPFVATIVDVTGLLIYFSFAALVLF